MQSEHDSSASDTERGWRECCMELVHRAVCLLDRFQTHVNRVKQLGPRTRTARGNRRTGRAGSRDSPTHTPRTSNRRRSLPTNRTRCARTRSRNRHSCRGMEQGSPQKLHARAPDAARADQERRQPCHAPICSARYHAAAASFVRAHPRVPHRCRAPVPAARQCSSCTRDPAR